MSSGPFSHDAAHIVVTWSYILLFVDTLFIEIALTQVDQA